MSSHPWCSFIHSIISWHNQLTWHAIYLILTNIYRNGTWTFLFYKYRYNLWIWQRNDSTLPPLFWKGRKICEPSHVTEVGLHFEWRELTAPDSPIKVLRAGCSPTPHHPLLPHTHERLTGPVLMQVLIIQANSVLEIVSFRDMIYKNAMFTLWIFHCI